MRLGSVYLCVCVVAPGRVIMFPRVPATRVQVISIACAFINPALRYLTGDALALRITTKSGSVEHRYAVRPLFPLHTINQYRAALVMSCRLMYVHTHTHTCVCVCIHTCEYKVLPLAPAHITLSPFLRLVCVLSVAARALCCCVTISLPLASYLACV